MAAVPADTPGWLESVGRPTGRRRCCQCWPQAGLAEPDDPARSAKQLGEAATPW